MKMPASPWPQAMPTRHARGSDNPHCKPNGTSVATSAAPYRPARASATTRVSRSLSTAPGSISPPMMKAGVPSMPSSSASA